MGNNPVNGTDPNGGWDWVKNSEGRYYDDPTVNESTDLNGTGWEYVGKELPTGVDPKGLDILVKIDGAFYYQNTTNLFAKMYNSFTDGSKMIEHKPYDAVAENALGEAITNGVVAGGATFVFKGFRYLRNIKNGDAVLKNLFNSSEKGVIEVVESEVKQLHNMYAQKAILRDAMLKGEKGAAQKFNEISELILQQEEFVNGYLKDMYKMFGN